MAFINGQWVDDRLLYGGTFDAPEDELIYGGTFDAPGLRPGPRSMARPGFPSQPPFGDRPGVPNLPPQMNPPGYSRGPQMQPSPFGGMLGDISQWSPVQQPVQQPQFPSLPPRNIFGPDTVAQPPRPPVMQPPVPPQVRSPLPPPPPNIGDVWTDRPSPEITLSPPIPPRPPVLPPIVDPPRRPEPPKKAKPKKVKRSRPKRGPKAPPPTRVQDVARGSKGPRTITGIARSQRGRGDR
jgi:hypothetical protein